MGAGAPKNNNNAEKWDLEKSTNFLNQCYKLARSKTDYVVYGKTIKGFEYHYIGELASELEQYSDLPKYLADKYAEIKPLYLKIKSKLESNCFSDSKKGIIKEATAIMNLKSNYNWTDRVEQNQNINDQRKNVNDLFPPEMNE